MLVFIFWVYFRCKNRKRRKQYVIIFWDEKRAHILAYIILSTHDKPSINTISIKFKENGQTCVLYILCKSFRLPFKLYIERNNDEFIREQIYIPTTYLVCRYSLSKPVLWTITIPFRRSWNFQSLSNWQFVSGWRKIPAEVTRTLRS